MNTRRPAHPLIATAAGLTLTLALASAPAAAQTAAPMLVDSTWLAQHVNDHDLVLLHVGTKADYEAAHIAGARLISEDDLSLPHDMTKMSTELMLELPPIDQLRAKVASFGISDDSRIVVYSAPKTAVQSSTRVIFTLDYLGLGDRTSLLNGGMSAWTRAGKSTTTEATAVRPGTLKARAPKNVVTDAAFVKTLAGRANYKLIDARAPVFYNGTSPSFNVSGHIPGAISIPFSEITDNNQMIDRDHVAALFQAAGVKQGDSLVAYCHVGQQATAVVFAARLLGHQVMLYDGSFQDWVINSRGPVEK
jgi:thiosulfate/3-mercaptopyruvate sulfurtransferase